MHMHPNWIQNTSNRQFYLFLISNQALTQNKQCILENRMHTHKWNLKSISGACDMQCNMIECVLYVCVCVSVPRTNVRNTRIRYKHVCGTWVYRGIQYVCKGDRKIKHTSEMSFGYSLCALCVCICMCNALKVWNTFICIGLP